MSFDPHTVIVSRSLLYIVRHEKADYYTGTPLGERLNILRYQITLRLRGHRFTINRNAIAAKWFSNCNWWLWKRAYVERNRRTGEKP